MRQNFVEFCKMNWFHDTARRFQMQFYTAVKINYFQPYYTKKNFTVEMANSTLTALQ